MKFFILFVMLMTTKLFSCDQVLTNFPFECEIQEKFEAQKEAFKIHAIDINFLSSARALRFIYIGTWRSYVLTNFDPSFAYKPAPQTWDSWNQTAIYLEREQDKKIIFTRELLSNINRRALQGRISDSKKLSPGIFRSFSNNQEVFYSVNCETKDLSEVDYSFYQNFDLKDRYGKNLVSLDVRACKNAIGYYEGKVKYLWSRKVFDEINRWLNFVNQQLEKFDSGMQDDKYSPLEFIADAQRWLVSIHPFADGNGRTSRFVQDLLTQHFKLPYLRSGMLARDVVTPKNIYRINVKNEVQNILNYFQECEENYETKPEEITNGCRTIVQDK